MKVGIIGTGYVGLPTGVGLAELGYDVVCIDKDESKINKLKKGQVTLFEDGLEELFKKQLQKGSLKFTTSMAEGVSGADIVILAVGTPPHPVTKEADMKYIYAAADELAEYLDGYTVVANKSTVPVGTGDKVEEIIRAKNPHADFDVVSLPEFLREGFAVYDFFNPDRIVIGANSERALQLVKELYKPFVGKTKILCVNRRSSETIKYASNAFLAIKIHYINEMADFCEQSGADIAEVAQGLGLDSRIGNKFLNAGPGYGGSCFPKDTNAMAYMGNQYGVNLSLIKAAIDGNDQRKKFMADRIRAAAGNQKDAKIAILGLAFKGGTDDCRESPAIQILTELLNHMDNVTVYDPQAMSNAQILLQDRVKYADSIDNAVEGADVVAILTEWEDFRKLDVERLKSLMRGNALVDLRNLLDEKRVTDAGFRYYRIGRKNV